MPETNYLKRAIDDLTREDGWWKPLLLLGLVACIPIVGPIVAVGYQLDWGKEAAWGMDRGLPRKVGSIGRRLRYGLIALVVYLVWLLPIIIVDALLSLIPGIGMLLHVICVIAALVLVAVATVAVLRGLVYERIEPGLHFVRVFKMAAHDTKHLAWAFAATVVEWIVSQVFSGLLGLAYAPVAALVEHSAATSVYSVGIVVSTSLLSTLLAVAIYCVGLILTMGINAVAIRIYGCWLAQFEPGKWGTPKDEMPFENEFANASMQATPVTPQTPVAETAAGAAAAAATADAAAPAAATAPAATATPAAAEPAAASESGTDAAS